MAPPPKRRRIPKLGANGVPARLPLRHKPYDAAAAARVCDRIAAGSTLRAACREERVNLFAFLAWLRDPNVHELPQRYAAARESQAEVLIDGAAEVAAGMHRTGKRAGTRDEAGAVARDRLDLVARQWLASKFARHRYGEHVTVAGDPQAPIRLGLARDRVSQRLDELEARLSGATVLLPPEGPDGAVVVVAEVPKDAAR